jgi:hypothetical protein
MATRQSRTSRPRRHIDRHGQHEAEPVSITLQCESARHHVCRGTVVSLLAPVGAHCQCTCHDGDDLATELALERANLPEVGW